MTAKIKLNAASGGGSFSLQAPSSSSNNRVLTLPDSADGTIAKTSDISFTSYAIIADQKSQNTNGGAFTAGDWRTRDLNTELSDENGIVSISSNQFTLGAGSYLIIGKAPAYDCNRHQVRIQNITDSTTTGTGIPLYLHTSYNPTNISEVVCRTSISTSKVFELQHRAESDKSNGGFGLAGNFGVEIYATVQIYKEV